MVTPMVTAAIPRSARDPTALSPIPASKPERVFRKGRVGEDQGRGKRDERGGKIQNPTVELIAPPQLTSSQRGATDHDRRRYIAHPPRDPERREGVRGSGGPPANEIDEIARLGKRDTAGLVVAN